jgi:hypothetical protein
LLNHYRIVGGLLYSVLFCKYSVLYPNKWTSKEGKEVMKRYVNSIFALMLNFIVKQAHHVLCEYNKCSKIICTIVQTQLFYVPSQKYIHLYKFT